MQQNAIDIDAWLPSERDSAPAEESMNNPLAPPIAGAADPEWESRIEAQRCTWQFSDAIRPSVPVASHEDLPLFGGSERQGELF